MDDDSFMCIFAPIAIAVVFSPLGIFRYFLKNSYILRSMRLCGENSSYWDKSSVEDVGLDHIRTTACGNSFVRTIIKEHHVKEAHVFYFDLQHNF